MVKLFFIATLFSQILFLGVFSDESTSYYVLNESENLCGVFEKGTKESPNWLQEGWYAIILSDSKLEEFVTTNECGSDVISGCCKSLGYKYAGVPIGEAEITNQRKAAEFLAGKNYIEKYSLSPSGYNLSDNITRKELMKIIMKISEQEIYEDCKGIFADVTDDWGCKYIETALDNDYIEGLQGFRPNDQVTKTEALKLIFKARNIQKAYNTDYWQEDYISTAYYKGFIDEKYKNYNETANRGWIFSTVSKTFNEYSNY